MESNQSPDEHTQDTERLAYSPRFQAMLEKSRRSIRETGALSGNEIWEGLNGDEESLPED